MHTTLAEPYGEAVSRFVALEPEVRSALKEWHDEIRTIYGDSRDPLDRAYATAAALTLDALIDARAIADREALKAALSG